LVRFDFYKKKVIKPKFFLKKPKPGQTDRFRSSPVFWAKPGSNRFGSVLTWFFPVLARFFGLARLWLGFSGLTWFFFLVFLRFGFGSVRFFQFFAYKTETEPSRPVFSKF
jgi:hypothetical protein